MAGPHNNHGVNETTACYRTIKGERYVGWTSGASTNRVAAYRAAGVRCRRLGDDLFVCHADEAKAKQVDAQVGPDF